MTFDALFPNRHPEMWAFAEGILSEDLALEGYDNHPLDTWVTLPVPGYYVVTARLILGGGGYANASVYRRDDLLIGDVGGGEGTHERTWTTHLNHGTRLEARRAEVVGDSKDIEVIVKAGTRLQVVGPFHAEPELEMS